MLKALAQMKPRGKQEFPGAKMLESLVAARKSAVRPLVWSSSSSLDGGETANLQTKSGIAAYQPAGTRPPGIALIFSAYSSGRGVEVPSRFVGGHNPRWLDFGENEVLPC